MIKFFAFIWLKVLKCPWSKLRWWKYRNTESRAVQKVDEDNMQSVVNDINNHFEWTMDDVSQLFDSMRPAPYLYNCYLNTVENGGKVTDDCDGCHTIIYHVLKQNGYDVALITVVTKPFTQSHTMTVIRNINKDEKNTYRVINYRKISKEYYSLDDFAKDYSLPVRGWYLHEYDYIGKKFRNVNKKDF